MKFSIPVKPLTTNRLWKGRRFKTKEYEDFEHEVMYSIGRAKEQIKGELFVKYTFYIKTYGISDVGNLEKGITDILVKLGYFEDDRYIRAIYMIKEKVKDVKEERIDVEILPFSSLSTV